MHKFLTIFVSLLFITGCFVQQEEIMGISLLLLFIYEVVYCIKDINKNISLLLFLTAFFTFLMGRLILPIFVDVNSLGDLFFSDMYFKKETILHTYISVFGSLLFLFISYRFYSQSDKQSLEPLFDVNSKYIKNVRRYSKIVTWLMLPFMGLVVLEDIYYVITYGYLSKYMEFESSLPSIVIIFSVLYEYFLYLYLSTLPSHKSSQWVILAYVLLSLTKMAAGDRGECMTALFVVIYYYFLRNRLSPGESKWIGKKGITMLVASVPVAILVLFSVSYIRNDSDVKGDTTVLMIGGFIYQQGASMNVIACEYEDEKSLPQGKWYSLGPLIDYFTNNHLTRLILGVKPYKVGSVELATKGHSLDPAITYLESPEFFYKGGGMGSSYIAEAYYDFGYIGILLISLFYGFILAKAPKMNSRNIWLSLIALIFIKFIMYAPRARALGFVAAALSVSFWPLAMILYIMAKNVKTHSLERR